MAYKRKRTNFKPGDALDKLANAAYLNSIEERLTRLENLYATPPLKFTNTQQGAYLQFFGFGPDDEFVRLQARLKPYCVVKATILELTTELGSSSSSTSSGCDIPLGETTEELDVVDLNGVTSLKDTNGIAKKIKRNNGNDFYAFIPWPLAQGDNLPNYRWDEMQVIGHDPQGWLRWFDVTECPTSSSTSSGL